MNVWALNALTPLLIIFLFYYYAYTAFSAIFNVKMESRNKDSLYENPCYGVSTSQQGSHDKSEADCDIYENLDPKESTKQTPTLKNDEPTTRKNGKRFLCAVICAIAVLVLISAVALILSLWNTFQLQSSTAEGALNLMQQSQLTENQLEEVKNALSILKITVQNLSNNQSSTAKAASNLMEQSQHTQNQLEEIKNDLAVFQEAIHNITSKVPMDLEKITSTLTALQYDTSNNFSAAIQSFINFELGAIEATLQQIIPVYSIPECGPGLIWRRLVYLNVSDPSQRCPPAWREYTTPVRSCGRPESTNPGCVSSVFSTLGISYRRICGRIIGYQKGSPDAYSQYSNTRSSIDHPYVDGISVTHGNPRTHIWTFVAGHSDRTTDITACLCANQNAPASPLFVGNNYFCESGTTHSPSLGTFYSRDPLWDSKGCVNSQCCTFNSPPWFNEQLPFSTTDDIEVRICGDEGTDNEDTPIELIEIYIQ